jgi:hypothetical protein
LRDAERGGKPGHAGANDRYVTLGIERLHKASRAERRERVAKAVRFDP